MAHKNRYTSVLKPLPLGKGSPEVSIVLGAAGLDFFFIDTEHSATAYADIQALCRTARAANIVPLVRLTQNDPALISRALDVGAMGIIVPHVHSRSQARTVVDAVKFPPMGHRGFGLGSIVTDFRNNSAQEEVESANRETLVVLMIESAEGLSCLEQISNVGEVDALFVGPYDLPLSLGILEQFDNPVFWQAMDRVIKAGEAAGVAVGLQSSNLSLLVRAREMGARFIMYGSDFAVLLEAYREAVRRLKA